MVAHIKLVALLAKLMFCAEAEGAEAIAGLHIWDRSGHVLLLRRGPRSSLHWASHHSDAVVFCLTCYDPQSRLNTGGDPGQLLSSGQHQPISIGNEVIRQQLVDTKPKRSSLGYVPDNAPDAGEADRLH